MRFIAAVVMLLVSGLALAATVYKWVDENGVTHYSDQPHPWAQKVTVAAPQTYSAPPPPAVAPAVKASPAASGPAYKTCEIFRPTADEVFFNVTTVTAKLSTDPQLREGDKVTPALDGKRLLDQASAATEFTLNPVYRGTHTVLAEVTDSLNKVLCTTPAVTFHVRQASTVTPQSPTKARTKP